MASTGRARELLDAIPVVTKSLLIINVSIYIGMFLMSTGLNNFSISEFSVITKHEYYRVVTSAFVHANAMHIFMNMSTLLQLGPNLEHSFGSISFFLVTFWAVLLSGCLYIVLSWAWAYTLNNPKKLFESGVGYSGVLFCYAVIEAFHTTESNRSVFGIFTVPARVYPFTLLILLQVLIPGISFLGHLSGILIGICMVYGLLGPLLLSSGWRMLFCGKYTITAIESRSYLGFGPLNQMPGFVSNNNRTVSIASLWGERGCGAAVCSTLSQAVGMVWNIITAMLHIVGVYDAALGCSGWVAVQIRRIGSVFSRPSSYETLSQIETDNPDAPNQGLSSTYSV